MKFRFLAAALLVLFVVSSRWLSATAQSPVVPTAVDAEDESGEEELRYEFLAHNFAVNGNDQEIFLKLDSWTGKTWRYHASSGRWTPVKEPQRGYPIDASEQFRYELFAHNYFTVDGEEQELILRTDAMSGFTWAYRGANGEWKDIPQEE